MDLSQEKYSKRQIKAGVVVSYASILLNIIAGLIYTPWLIGQLGDGRYGIYTIAVSLIAMLVMDFGISDAVAKYISQYRAENREDKIKRLLSIVIKIYLVIALILFLIFSVMYFFLDKIYLKLTPAELEQFKIVYIIIASFNILAFPFTPLSGIMLAYEHIVSLKVCDILNRVITILLTVIALRRGYGLYAVVAVNAIAGIIVILYKLFVIQGKHHFKLDLHCKDTKMLHEILKFSLWVTVLALTQRLIVSITPSIIGAMSGTRDATIFGVAGTLEGYAYNLGSVLAGIYMAKISRIISGDDKNNLEVLLVQTGHFQLVIFLCILIGVICAGQEFILVWMGERFAASYYCTVLILAPNFFAWPFFVAGTALTAAGRVKEQAIVNIFAAVANIAIDFLLVSVYGAVGASIALAVANAIKGIGLMYMYNKYLKVNIWRLIKKIYVPFIVPTVFSVFLGRKICSLYQGTGWLLVAKQVITVGGIMVIGYGITLVVLYRGKLR